MIKSIFTLITIVAAVVSAQMTGVPLTHISFTQPVEDGITYEAGTTQTFSWTTTCTPPSTLVSATPNATEVDFMDSNNINNAFYVKKVGTIDCTKSVGNLVWTVPADTKPGVYALQLLLSPNNAYSGRFNVTAPGGSNTSGRVGTSGTGTGGAAVGGDGAGGNGGADASGTGSTQSTASVTSLTVGKTVAAMVVSVSAAFALAL
ncbi:MAG: hypothetical protein J3Q66DRAFT_370474 [Benniella sp.]|nr:MAG: hypothetical protein J3Q66DRAFT_370474 [Benniella sp.]